MRKMTFGKGKNLSRRKFIVGSAAVAGGGLALGLNAPFAAAQNGAAASAAFGPNGRSMPRARPPAAAEPMTKARRFILGW